MTITRLFFCILFSIVKNAQPQYKKLNLEYVVSANRKTFLCVFFQLSPSSWSISVMEFSTEYVASHWLVIRQYKCKTCCWLGALWGKVVFDCLPTQNSRKGKCDICKLEVLEYFHPECQGVQVEFFNTRWTQSKNDVQSKNHVCLCGCVCTWGWGVDGRAIHMFFISREVFVLQSWDWPLLCATSSLPQPIQSPLNQKASGLDWVFCIGRETWLPLCKPNDDVTFH